MNLLTLLVSISTLAIVEAQPSASLHEATIFIQPVTSRPPPATTLATLNYNTTSLTGTILSYEPPLLSDESSSTTALLRILAGTSTSTSSTLTSAQNFQKGYRPVLVVALDTQDEIISVAVKSERIDAGQTRDFGPRVVVRAMERARGPVLNKPVVLKEGRVEGVEVEKTLLQKYWWVGLALIMLMMTAGGGGE